MIRYDNSSSKREVLFLDKYLVILRKKLKSNSIRVLIHEASDYQATFQMREGILSPLSAQLLYSESNISSG